MLTRAQRRKLERFNKKIMKNNKEAVLMPVTDNPDFSQSPTATLCQGMMLIINELNRRGQPVRDFDNKDKYIQGVQIIKNEVYFMAAGDIADEN